MRTTVLILCGAAAVLGSIATWLHVTNDRLRTQRGSLMPSTASLASATPRPLTAPPISDREVAELRAEVESLEAKVAASASKSQRNTDITRGFVLGADMHNAGRETPVTAFETLAWAAIHGDESALAELMAIGPADRAQMAEHLSRIGSNRTPEQVAGVLFADEVLRKAESFQVIGSTQVDATHVKVATKVVDIAERESKATIPMVLGPGGWQLEVPEGLARRLEQELKQSPPTESRPSRSR